MIGFSLFGALAGEGQMTESGKVLYLQNAAFVWVIPIAIMTVLAWFGMNDLSGAKASFKEQSVIFGRQAYLDNVHLVFGNFWLIYWF